MRKELKVALLGPGGVGKTTIINYLKPFLNKHNFIVLKDRSVKMMTMYQKYQNNMKKTAFEMQCYFFKMRLKQRKAILPGKRIIIDRDIIDDFVYPKIHIQLGNFSNSQTLEWKKIEKNYLAELAKLSKIDLAIVLYLDLEENMKRIMKRSQIDPNRKQESHHKNTKFFELANKAYTCKKSILNQTLNFAKVSYKLNNINTEKTAKKIAYLITNY